MVYKAFCWARFGWTVAAVSLGVTTVASAVDDKPTIPDAAALEALQKAAAVSGAPVPSVLTPRLSVINRSGYGPSFVLRTAALESLSVDLDAADGRIRSVFVVDRPDFQLTPSSQPKSLPMRKKGEIVATTIKHLKALGVEVTAQMRLEGAKYHMRKRTWGIGWRRYVGDYPTQERISVTIDDTTGRLLACGDTTTNQSPDLAIYITEKHAVELAESVATRYLATYIAEKQLYPKRTRCKMEIIYPNYQWTSKESSVSQAEALQGARKPRLAHVVVFDVYSRIDNKKYEPISPTGVWIDAQAGEALGAFSEATFESPDWLPEPAATSQNSE